VQQVSLHADLAPGLPHRRDRRVAGLGELDAVLVAAALAASMTMIGSRSLMRIGGRGGPLHGLSWASLGVVFRLI
jgi:hypothetical protein